MPNARIILRPALSVEPSPARADEHSYALTAPLDDDGRIDLSAFGGQRWPVRRVGSEEGVAMGWLAHRGSHWFIDYDLERSDDDEPIFRLGDHRFLVGEYVTITEHDGVAQTFRVVSVEPLNTAH